MKSILIPKPFEIRINESSIPEPGPEEVLIKIRYVGFCGSDLSSFMGRNPMVNYPVIPGHEIAGTIEKKGSRVPDHLSMEQAITIVPYTNCGACPSCKRGRHNACQYNQTLGVQRDGAMSEYIAIPWEKIIVAKGLSMKELALTEPLTVGFHAISRGRVESNDIVAVLGCGIIGIGAIIGSAERGAIVIAVDVDDEKLKLAKRIGAKYTINSKTEDIDLKLKQITLGNGPDLVIEAAGQPATYLAAISAVAFTGRVVCIGYAQDDIAFATKLFVQKELDILGSRNATPEDFDQVIRYLSKGKLPLNELISSIVSPENTHRALMNWAENQGKVFKILVDFTLS